MEDSRTHNRQAAPSGNNQSVSRSLVTFLAPKYWGIWCVFGIMRASAGLPYGAQIHLGRMLGKAMYAVMGQRRRVADRNIELCFPELDTVGRTQLVKAHFQSLGLSLMEMALGWWASDRKISRLMTVEGVEYLEAALAKGKGAILVTAHFTSVEASGRAFAKVAPPFMAMYRTNRNPFLDEILRRGRLKSAAGVIAKDDVKSMLRALKANTPVLYAPDQRYGRKLSALVPFFSVPAMTNVATSQLARLSGAPVLPYLPLRLPDNKGYLLSILPPIDGFPSGDAVADTQRYHAIVEAHIRKDPAQYYWVHRRFGRRPDPLPDPYENLGE